MYHYIDFINFDVRAQTFISRIIVDYLKIDGSFVRNLRKDAGDKHLVTAMVTLAGSLGKQTIAEFVEDEETLEILIVFNFNI